MKKKSTTTRSERNPTKPQKRFKTELYALSANSPFILILSDVNFVKPRKPPKSSSWALVIHLPGKASARQLCPLYPLGVLES